MQTIGDRFELVEVGGAEEDDFARAVVQGLAGAPKSLPCRFLYDEEGSRLFERICTLEEYYPTRAERAILVARAGELAERFGDRALIELGSGNAEKTEHVLAAFARSGRTVHYVPVDICGDVLLRSGERLVEAHPGLRVTAVVGEYRAGLARAAGAIEGPKLVLLLGGSVGNFTRSEAAAFLGSLGGTLGPEDAFLLGVDLRKERAVLERAYDDAAGVTAAFTKNLLARVNRELGGDLDPEAFAHEARYDEEAGVVRLHLVSLRDQVARIAALGRDFHFAEGERLHTEDSTKYSWEEIDALAGAAGFETLERWTDPDELFGVVLWRRA